MSQLREADTKKRKKIETHIYIESGQKATGEKNCVNAIIIIMQMRYKRKVNPVPVCIVAAHGIYQLRFSFFSP